MKHFYLIANPSKQGTKEMAREIAAYMAKRGATCVEAPQREDKRRGVSADEYQRVRAAIPEDTECVITLGGDGTLIRAARNLVGYGLPLLGINMGTLGYLTQIAHGEALAPMLEALLEDNFHLERRMMLGGEVISGDGQPAFGGIALNEIVLSRTSGLQAIHFQLYVNGTYLNEYTADGIIVATPTGSTAYNLSAGGPIVTPGAELMVLTPICSHALNNRSIVLTGQDTVEIRPLDGGEIRQAVSFDGAQTVELDGGGRLLIRKSQYDTTMIRLKEVSFLDHLRNKMDRV